MFSPLHYRPPTTEREREIFVREILREIIFRRGGGFFKIISVCHNE